MVRDCDLRQLAWFIQSIQYVDFRLGWRPAADQLIARLDGVAGHGQASVAKLEQPRRFQSSQLTRPFIFNYLQAYYLWDHIVDFMTHKL